jgi:glycosyltransferase involved in cell wall biosynthesis
MRNDHYEAEAFVSAKSGFALISAGEAHESSSEERKIQSMSLSDELVIVIPAKNEEMLLPRLLASLIGQDYPLISDTRVFISDADSTDRTTDVAKEYGRHLPITVIRGGLPSVGRNNGARCSYSRYILFLDADIELADPTLLRRAVETMKRKALHCVTTDIRCRDGSFIDRLLYRGNNLVQRLSRLHKPFATGMFMLLDREQFDELGGFDELALYAEDYQLTRQIKRSRFHVVPGGIYSTNRRFRKMGHWTIIRYFLSTAIHSRKPNHYRNRYFEAYWQAY